MVCHLSLRGFIYGWHRASLLKGVFLSLTPWIAAAAENGEEAALARFSLSIFMGVLNTAENRHLAVFGTPIEENE